MADWISKRHDTRRVLETNLGPPALLTARLAATLQEIVDGVPGTGLKCIAKLAQADGKTPIPGSSKVNAAAEVVTAGDGRVRYSPVAADVNASGLYLVEWQVKGSDGKTDTYPTDGYDTWLILDDLDDAP